MIALLAVSFVTQILIVPQTNAWGCEGEDKAAREEFYARNDIPSFYDPCSDRCSAGGEIGGAGGKIATLRGEDNATRIYNFWIDTGLSPKQAAGITGSIKHESGFSPFRQETTKSWPDGGWGIAQFTFDPGQRGYATAYVKADIGIDLFNQYYKNEYGGAVLESNGFIPTGVPEDVNNKFLLSELNYLYEHIQELKPNNIRWSAYQRDYSVTPTDTTLYEYLRGLDSAGDAAKAWTYLYEYPGDIKNTAANRAISADEILTAMAGNDASAMACDTGGLIEGGMTLDQAVAFMESYKSDPEATNLLGGAGRGCSGGPLANCVSFSVYFINKYTTFEGFMSGAPGNGIDVAGNVASRNPTAKTGVAPQPYAIFSGPGSGVEGHTGIILGVDTVKNVVIVGEAGCGQSMDWITAREYPLDEYTSGAYKYVYTDGFLKGGIDTGSGVDK